MRFAAKYSLTIDDDITRAVFDPTLRVRKKKKRKKQIICLKSKQSMVGKSIQLVFLIKIDDHMERLFFSMSLIAISFLFQTPLAESFGRAYSQATHTMRDGENGSLASLYVFFFLHISEHVSMHT